jgi:hypothetical protein
MRADLEAVAARAILINLRDAIGEEPDEQLLLDCLEGQTNVFEMAKTLLEMIEAEEGNIEALTAQMAARKERRDRAAKRIEQYRTAIMAMMESGGIDKLPLPEATCSLRKVAPKLIVTDENLLPDELCKITRKPDMAAIRAAGNVAGTAFDNGGVSLTIRRS